MSALKDRTLPNLNTGEDSESVAPEDNYDISENPSSVTETDATTPSNQSGGTPFELAKEETNIVFRLRVLVFFVLFLAAVIVCVVVFLITSGSEDEEASTQYEAAAEKILETFVHIVDLKLVAVSSLGVATIAHGVDHTRTWPFVTLSSFQQRAATARSESGALYIHINHFVTDDDRKEWEEFVAGKERKWM